MATQHKQFSLEKTLTENIDLTNCGDVLMEVFENIKVLCLFKGWTQEEMAEKLQILDSLLKRTRNIRRLPGPPGSRDGLLSGL